MRVVDKIRLLLRCKVTKNGEYSGRDVLLPSRGRVVKQRRLRGVRLQH